MQIDKNALRNICIGAGLMFIFDPRMGKRRRALLRDRFRHFERAFFNALSRSSRDFNQRARGMVIEAKSRLVIEHVPDDVLVERVRSKIGRVVSHPHAIGIDSRNGCITVSGPVFADQASNLMHCVARVRGVSSVRNHLEVHALGDHAPGLGPHHKTVNLPRWLIPRKRLLGVCVVSGLAASEIYFSRRRNSYGFALGGVALALFAKGFEGPSRLRQRNRYRRRRDPMTSLTDQLTLTRMTHH